MVRVLLLSFHERRPAEGGPIYNRHYDTKVTVLQILDFKSYFEAGSVGWFEPSQYKAQNGE